MSIQAVRHIWLQRLRTQHIGTTSTDFFKDFWNNDWTKKINYLMWANAWELFSLLSPDVTRKFRDLSHICSENIIGKYINTLTWIRPLKLLSRTTSIFAEIYQRPWYLALAHRQTLYILQTIFSCTDHRCSYLVMRLEWLQSRLFSCLKRY